MKKVLSIVMALALVLALAVPAFAVEIPDAEVIASFEGPKTPTNWWYDAWLDSDQKGELADAMYTGGANYIVVVFEGDVTDYNNGGGYQIGSQDTTAWTNDLFHFNYPAEGAVDTATKVDVIDGNSYVYLSVATYLDYIGALGYDYSAGTGFNWIIGAPGEYPLLGMYAVKADIVVEEAPADPAEGEEAPADDTPAVEETPADTTEEPADTGLALAIVPMVVAAAAIALSKKR